MNYQLNQAVIAIKSRIQDLAEIFQQFLPDTTSEQQVQYATSVVLTEELNTFLQKFPTDLKHHVGTVKRIHKDVDYKKPFRIAVVAATGMGKSTLLNALLGRDLVLAKGEGGATTGCALQIFHTDEESEKAIVKYRDEKNILDLIREHLICPYQLDTSRLIGTLDDGYASILSNQVPGLSLSEEDKLEFDELRNTLVDLVRQYVRNSRQTLQTKFVLSEDKDKNQLLRLIDEGSALNSNVSSRQVGLVKCVNYYVKLSQPNGLKLPSNVCLVDLPGLDGTRLHNLIIQEGIEDADAVIFVVHPRRFKTLMNKQLLNKVSRYIVGQGESSTIDRLFLVVNAKDEKDSQQGIETLYNEVSSFVEQLFPGSNQHHTKFLVSAFAALQAQKAMRGENIDQDDYDAAKIRLGVRDGDHHAVLAQSHVPYLVEALNSFVSDRLNRQVRDAQRGLSHVISSLIALNKQEYQALTQGGGDIYLKLKANNVLQRKLEELEEIVENFREAQIDSLDDFETRLQPVLRQLCDDVDEYIQSETPKFWKEHFVRGRCKTRATRHARSMREPFLGQVEASLWEQLASRTSLLAEEVVNSYSQGLDNIQLPLKLLEQSFEFSQTQEFEQRIQKQIESMRLSLETTIRVMTLTQLVEPANGLTEYPEGGDLGQSQLLEALRPIPLVKEVDSSEFTSFVQAVRQHYEPLLQDVCIRGMLNLYCYEMLRIEEMMVNYLRETFERLRLSDDPELLQKILTSEAGSELEQVQLIEQKLSELEQFQSILLYDE